jgi:hypothetical protein
MSRYQILANRLGMSAGLGGGGGDEPKEQPKKQLSYDQINQWSGFVENNPNLGSMDAMWEAFSKKFPNSGIDRLTLTQNLDNLARMTTEGTNRFGNKGGVTTGLSFPRMTFNGKDYGRVNALMQTQTPIPQPQTQYPEKFIQKRIPYDVTDVWYDEEKGLYAYDDPREGVIKYATKEAASDPKIIEIIKRNIEKNKQ